MTDDHTKNYFLALALSVVVVLIWSIFVIPQEQADEQAVEEARQETQEAEGTLPRTQTQPGVQAPPEEADQRARHPRNDDGRIGDVGRRDVDQQQEEIAELQQGQVQPGQEAKGAEINHRNTCS